MVAVEQPERRILVVGLGSQGWAITRQLLAIWDDDPRYQLFVYDVDEERMRTLVPDQISAADRPALPVTRALAAGRLRRLPGSDGGDPASLRRAILALEPHLLLNASPADELYPDLACEAESDYVDLGHGSWQGLRKRALEQRIRETGCRMRCVPECGVTPGLLNIFGAWLLQFGGDSLQLRAGGVPMDTHKGDGLHYGVSWSVAGLIQGLTDVTIARQDGRIVSIAGLSSRADREEPGRICPGVEPLPVTKAEVVERLREHMEEEFFAPTAGGGWAIRHLEARPTSDGASLMPFDAGFAHLAQLEFKTLRYYPHFDLIEKWQAAGTLAEELARRRESGIPDLILLRAWTEEAGSVKAMLQGVVLCDRELEHDRRREVEQGAPFFTAMEHLTGWPTCLAVRALLEGEPSQLLRRDHPLWSGRSLAAALRDGGVIMPYELLDGERVLAELDCDRLIPHRELRLQKA